MLEIGKQIEISGDVSLDYSQNQHAGANAGQANHNSRVEIVTNGTAGDKGVPLRALQDIMGHSSSQVTELYTRLAAEALSKEMGKF